MGRRYESRRFGRDRDDDNCMDEWDGWYRETRLLVDAGDGIHRYSLERSSELSGDVLTNRV